MSTEDIINLVNVQVIPWSLFLIMLGMGLSLVPDDFRRVVVQALLAAGPVTLILNLSTMLIGYAAARWLHLNRAQSISITMEVGLQNSSLAMVMALGLLGNYEMSLTPAIYTLVMFSSAGMLAYWVSRGRVIEGNAVTANRAL